MVTRRAAESYAASIVTRAQSIPCIGARDDTTFKALTAPLKTQSIRTVKSLRRDASPMALLGVWVPAGGCQQQKIREPHVVGNDA